MAFKIIVGIIAAALLLVYMAPVVLRLNDMALWAVSGTGAAMMLLDLWQSLRE